MGRRAKTLQHTPNYAAAVFLLSAYVSDYGVGTILYDEYKD